MSQPERPIHINEPAYRDGRYVVSWNEASDGLGEPLKRTFAKPLPARRFHRKLVRLRQANRRRLREESYA